MGRGVWGGGGGEGVDRGVWGGRGVGGSACGNLNGSINLAPKFCNPVCEHYSGNTFLGLKDCHRYTLHRLPLYTKILR